MGLESSLKTIPLKIHNVLEMTSYPSDWVFMPVFLNIAKKK
jgi:hypothetical protein